MSLPKIKAPGAAHSMKVDDGNGSLDTYIRQAIGREPFLSFSRANDSPVQWIQLLHALDQQADLPGWPLLSPSKVQMQKCDKCSYEFCSTINYRRHMRLHRRNLNLDKDSTIKNRGLLHAFWDKLCQEEAMKIMSFDDDDDVSVEGVTGSSIVKALSSFIRKLGFSYPQSYVRSGSALLDIVQGKPSRFPISSQELFSILDDASEKTFLFAGTAETLQKYVFEGEAAKIGLEMRNLVACTSFLVEQKLVKACLANKEAEALRHQKLLVEEEEAAQKRQAALSEKKRQKKLRQRGQRAKEQATAETDDTTVDSPPSPPELSQVYTPDSTLEVLEVPQNTTVSSESVQIKRVEEDKSHGKDTPEDSLPSPPTSSPVDTPDSILEVAEVPHDTTLSSKPGQIKHVKDLDKSHEKGTPEDSPHPPPTSSPVDTPPDSILEVPEVPHNTTTALSSESVRVKHLEDLDKSLEKEVPEDSPVNTPDSILQVPEVPQNTTLSSELVQIKHVEDLDKSREIEDPDCDTSLKVDPDLGPHQTVEHRTSHRSARRHRFYSRSQAPKLQRTPNALHTSHNYQATKLEIMQKHASSRDSRIAVTNIGKVWTPKPKLGTDEENCRTRSQIQEPNLHEQDKKHEVLIGSIPVTLRKRNNMQQDKHLGQAPESSALELSKPDVDGSHERPVKTETVEGTANPSTVKLWRPVSRQDNGGQLPIQNVGGACEIGSIPCNDSNQAQQSCEENYASVDSVLQRGSKFSSHEAEAFLSKRWKEAIESEHVKLTLFSEDSQLGCSEGDGLNQETTSSKEEQHGIVCSDKSHSESYTNLEHLTTVKSKARAKAEKGSKVKYVPKKSGY